MLSRQVKRRIRTNRILRATPSWQVKRNLYAMSLMPGSASILSSKHLAPEYQAQHERDINERVAHAEAVKQMDRRAWQELEKTLYVGYRWTPHQMKRTVRATGGYEKVLTAHGGFLQKLQPKPVFPEQAQVPMNWDNPARIDENGDWEAEHESTDWELGRNIGDEGAPNGDHE